MALGSPRPDSGLPHDELQQPEQPSLEGPPQTTGLRHAPSRVDAHDTTGVSWISKVGWLLPIAASAAVVAAMLQAYGPLSAPYTWTRPYEILKDVLQRRHALTLLLLGYIFGWFARAREDRSTLESMWRSHSRRERVYSCLVIALGAAGDLAWFGEHSPLDHLAAGLMLLVAVGGVRPREKNKGQLARTGIELACTLIAFSLVSYSFTVVKAHLFLLSAPQDARIVGWERAVFARPLHVAVTEWALVHPSVIRFSDRIYYYLFDHMAIVSAFLSGLNRPAVRQRYVSALCLCYIVGAASYYAFPSVGPAFFDPGTFVFIRDMELQTRFVQEYLFYHTNAAINGTLKELPTYAFLAAMPSLHMAHEFVMLWYSWRSPIFGLLAALFTLSTYFAILVLGWHYASDMIGGVVLAVFSIFVAERASMDWFPAAARPREPS